MKVVLDTSALIAVLLGESNRDVIIRRTEGVDLIAPASLHWEVGNALSAMFKRGRLGVEPALQALRRYQEIPIQFVDADMAAAVRLCDRLDLYAYDAYMLEVANRHRAPLLTLDGGLQEAARHADVELLQTDP
jgi:predicted nucleic acid-binding protein